MACAAMIGVVRLDYAIIEAAMADRSIKLGTNGIGCLLEVAGK